MRANGKKILLPVNQPHFTLVGVPPSPLSRNIDEAVGLLASELADMVEREQE
jgi:hypothetical protein